MFPYLKIPTTMRTNSDFTTDLIAALRRVATHGVEIATNSQSGTSECSEIITRIGRRSNTAPTELVVATIAVVFNGMEYSCYVGDYYEDESKTHAVGMVYDRYMNALISLGEIKNLTNDIIIRDTVRTKMDDEASKGDHLDKLAEVILLTITKVASTHL
jgi:hypothetical protein